MGKIDILTVTQGITKNQCTKYKIEINILKAFKLFRTGISLLHVEPYQNAMPDKVNAVAEIGQYFGESNNTRLKIRSNIEINGKAYCKIKK